MPGYYRPRGLYIAGNIGTGKTSLIQHLALTDIRRGHGVAVIDPKGTLVDRLSHHIPEKRAADDVIYFDTNDPVPIDLFSYSNPAERSLLLDMLLEMFDLEDAPISNPRLLAALDTLLNANERTEPTNPNRCTFLDVTKFFTDKERRDQILNFCPNRKAEWRWLDDVKSPESKFESILERMRPFTLRGPLNSAFRAYNPNLNIANIVAKNQILLVNLRNNKSANFLGSLILTKFQQAIFARRDLPKLAYTPYYLYIDECHKVVKYSEETIEDILAMAREYRLCITLANQLPTDLPESIRRKLNMVYGKVLFNLDPKDAALFKDKIEAATTPEFLAYIESGRTHQAANQARSDLNRKLEGVVYDINWLKEHTELNSKQLHHLRALSQERDNLNQQLAEMPPYYFPPSEPYTPRTSHLSLQTFPDFTALAILANHMRVISTPKFLGFSSASYAKYIKTSTVDKYGCKDQLKSYTETNAHSSSQEKDGGGQGKITKVPPNPHKKKRPDPPC